ncbi:hypothetical protein AMTRI_Chr06g175100 [Amborella trichopoda]
MAEAGGLPKRKFDEAEDRAGALHKRRRISESNFDEDRLQDVPVFSSQVEQDQAKNQEIEETGAQKGQDRAKNQEIDEIRAQKAQEETKNQEIGAEEERDEAINQVMAAGDENQERESGDQEMREGETSQEGGAMIPELQRIFEHSEAQQQCLVKLVDMVQEGRRGVELSDLLRNLQLESNCLTSELEVLTRQLEKPRGTGRNDQPDVEGSNPEPQEPYFDSPF